MFNEGFFGLVIWRFSDELRWKIICKLRIGMTDSTFIYLSRG